MITLLILNNISEEHGGGLGGSSYLKNHTAKLSSKQKLLALANQGVDGKVLTHV